MITYRKDLTVSRLYYCNCSMYKNLMQLNWRWHHKRLKQPCQALQPYTNLHHGAALLKAAFATKHDWSDAAGVYHSPGQNPRQRQRAKVYAQRVLRHQARLEAS